MISIPFRNITIRAKEQGQGPPIILLHGYLESLEIWTDMAEVLAEEFRVISIDIPGHGQSGILAPVHSMELMAEAVGAVVKHFDISKCVLVGHSMGGYIALACMEAKPEWLKGIFLFHSTPYADSEQKKADRMKEIRLIEAGKLTLICNTSIPKSFARVNHYTMQDKIEFAKQIARQTPPEGAVALLRGMSERLDRTHLVKEGALPVMFLLGLMDEYIDMMAVYSKFFNLPNCLVKGLEDSAHSGYLEQTQISSLHIRYFAYTTMGAPKVLQWK